MMDEAINNANGPKMDKIRKDVISLFKTEGLSITIETNLIETDFLDVTFNISSKKYWPYRKPGNPPLYVNVNSNHPPTIIKKIPSMINKRLVDTSRDPAEFNKAKGIYETALKANGYEAKMSYDQQPTPLKHRGRKIIWFNPPYNRNVKTNIGKSFLKLLKKHFTRDHKYFKIFNINTNISNASNVITHILERQIASVNE